jgi:translocation and assembly module TamB
VSLGRWHRWIAIGLFFGGAAALAVAVVFETGLVEPWIRRAVVGQIEQRTGARVEMGGFHLHILSLQVEIDNLTLDGVAIEGAPPLFHADRVDVGVRILSFFRRRMALERLIVERPQVFVRIEKDGRSNLPRPKIHANNRPWRETLFNLQIARLELRDGSAIFNDRRVPLAIAGQNLEFSLSYNFSANGRDSYIGDLRWQDVEMAERRDVPFRFDLSAKFTLHRDAFELDELVCKLPHSELDLRAELPSFSRADWTLRYRGRLSLADVRTIFRAKTVPGGVADFSGQASYSAAGGRSGEWTANGYYRAHDIRMPYQWFHATGLETWGNYEIARLQLVVPNLSLRALGGTADGRLEMDFRGLAFRTETHLHGASLAATLAAVDNPNLPVDTLHWDGAMDVDSVNTWSRNFKHFRSRGQSRWSPPGTLGPGMIPVTARIDYEYSQDLRAVAISQSEITTPESQLEMDGPLGAVDSAVEIKFRTANLLAWDELINTIRGPSAARKRIAGRVAWTGRILGPLVGPTFIGRMHADQAHYDKLYWDQVDGDLEYSPDRFRLTKTVVKRGGMSVTLDLAIEFDSNWGFAPESPWNLEGRLEHAPCDDLQAMFETNFPVSGFLTGDFHAGGTRAAPVFDSNFIFEEIEAKGYRFDRLSGQLHVLHNEIRLSRAELRRGSGRIAGDILYRPQEQQTVFNLTGTAIALDRVAELQTSSMPIGGQLDFNLRGSGPLRTPVAEGDLRLVNLKLGSEVEGNFTGQLGSDGRSARLSLTSEMGGGKLQGELQVGLTGDQTISGRLSVGRFDLDPFIVSGLHLKQLTSHSSADGVFTFSGALRQPDSIAVDADITRISFDYEFVQLTNDQDIRITYHKNELRIEQAHLHGTETDAQLSGSARFDRDRPLHLSVSGGLNLRLVRGMLPDLDARGSADMNVSVEGTMDRPRITGRASVRDASANYAEFPVGISKVNGDLIFDKSRLVFDRVTAVSGGGQLTLSGNVTYGEGPLRYEVSAQTSTVRIRYPAGLSWLASGTVELTGTGNASLVSGHVEVERLLFAEGVDVASFFAAASESSAAPVSNSTFLQNLTFDVEGQTSPGARIEWAGAQIEVDGDVRLRGTWDRPVLLGHIHLLGGQMPFRGNTYQLTHGDINFANPFRLDPVLNVEATSTISQYQVTIDFSGTASRLTLNYRSDPPLPEQDIIGLLALGRTGQETGPVSQAASQNYGATALLSEAISSGLGGRIEHLFGISQFRVDPFVAGTATESNAAARITIEQQVTRDLTITYSSNAATSNQYQLIQVEYAVKRDLSVVFLRDINGTYGLDIKWVKRLK